MRTTKYHTAEEIQTYMNELEKDEKNHNVLRSDKYDEEKHKRFYREEGWIFASEHNRALQDIKKDIEDGLFDANAPMESKREIEKIHKIISKYKIV